MFLDYNPKVVLDRLKHLPKSLPRVARAEKFKVTDISETDEHDQTTDLFDQYVETTTDFDPDFEIAEDYSKIAAETDSGSDEDENICDTIVIEAKLPEPKSRSKHWKTIGPQEFLYRDTYTVYQKDDGFVCALCSVKTKNKDNMRGHLKIVHLKYPSM